ncbi:MAG TPA: ABC transporter permease [Terracidiphilus sp.]|nr:ABC transporter permease [Terracidiphilus sp.]
MRQHIGYIASVAEGLGRDLRWSLRQCMRSRGLAAAAIVTLALGLGANTAIFSIVEAVLLRPLPYKNPERLVVVWQTDAEHRESGAYFNSYREFAAWQQQSRSFEKLTALTWATGPKTATWNGTPVDMLAIPASRDFFAMLGATAALGRTFADSDLSRGCTVVLAHNFWQRKLGGAADVVGKSIDLESASCQVVGVMPKSFAFYPSTTDAWTLITPTGAIAQQPWKKMVGAFGLLKPGVSRAAAEAELNGIQKRVVNEAPPDLAMMRNWSPDVLDLQSNFTWLAGRNLRKGLWLLLGASALILLMASVNVGGLLLGRAMEKSREVAVRSALGSSQARLLRALLVEALVLGMAGTAAGVALAEGLIRWFKAVNPVELPPGADVSLDWRVLIFAIASGMAASLLFGLLPTWHNARVNTNELLKSGTRGQSQSAGSARTTRSLVVIQVALSIVLLGGASCMTMSLWKLTSTDLGYRADDLFTARVTLPEARYEDAGAQRRFASGLETRLRGLPGVRSAAIASDFLPNGLNNLSINGKTNGDTTAADVMTQAASDGLLATLEIPLLRGRMFDGRDGAGAEPVAIVNQALAREYFGGENPIGKAIKLSRAEDQTAKWMTIIGVAGDVKTTTVFQEMGYLEPPVVYRPLAQSPDGRLALMIASTGRRSGIEAEVRREVLAMDGSLVLSDVDAMGAMRDAELSPPRFRAALIAGFALLALVLALVGLYGSLSQMIVRRRHEVSIRMALGADRGRILRDVLGQACAMTLMGALIGGAAGAFGLRLVHSMFYGIGAGGALELVGAAAVLLILTIAAALHPAWHAASLDPMQALKNE